MPDPGSNYPANRGERWWLEGGRAGTYGMKMWPSQLSTADIPIRASAVGEVARFGITGSRVEVAVDHGGGWSTIYNVPNTSDVRVGLDQPVNPGQVIATMPNTADYLLYGKLYWYKHNDPTGGAVSWEPRRQVGSGWL